MADQINNLTYPKLIFRDPRNIRKNIQSLLDDLRKNSKKGLNIGCGFTKIEGLTNCDLYNPSADLKVDSSDLNIFNDGEVDYIESNHMIEHLSFETTEKAIQEWSRVTANNGILVLTFPDFTAISLLWLRLKIYNFFISQQEKLDYVIQMIVGSQENEGMFHRNAFDLNRMTRLLNRHGYKIEFSYCQYPKRPTPSRIVIARRFR